MKSLKELDQEITVVTSTYVMQDNMPVLYVSCDEDNEDENGCLYQFHCDNGDYNADKMILVKLGTVLKKDETLNNLVLEIGEEVKRPFIAANWIKTIQ